MLAGLSGRALPTLPHVPVRGPVRPARGRTRLVPVAWDGSASRIVSGHGSAFLHGATMSDAPAALTPDWTDGDPAPLVLTPG
ncbi:hypothetical protein ACFCY8_01595 [Streptomyces noursei]|uniref:hypothetical protein n=1 Tax=Streptomyces noursei TaxID=1971 RepID=UPI0035D56E82